jgi:hypothetical protein
MGYFPLKLRDIVFFHLFNILSLLSPFQMRNSKESEHSDASQVTNQLTNSNSFNVTTCENDLKLLVSWTQIQTVYSLTLFHSPKWNNYKKVTNIYQIKTKHIVRALVKEGLLETINKIDNSKSIFLWMNVVFSISNQLLWFCFFERIDRRYNNWWNTNSVLHSRQPRKV